MKNILLLFALLGLMASCAKTIEERQEEHRKCSEIQVKKFYDKYEKIPKNERQLKFFGDLCEFNKVPQEHCMQTVAVTHMQGKLNGAINHFIYMDAVKPECGDFPVEDKETKDK